MNVSLRWLREYVAADLPVPELIERLTIAGLEVSGVRVYGLDVPAGVKVKPEDLGPVWNPDTVKIARVLSVTQHPNAERLKLVTLEYGAPEPKVVVTGAPNIGVGDSGQIVIVALTGSVLFDGHATPKKLSELRPTTLRGVPSDAMVCSAFELGIHEDHDGIILLQPDAPVGAAARDYLGDIVITVDVLPNMARCLAVLGVAREVAALTGATVTPPADAVATSGEPLTGQVTVAIEDPALSARYSATLVRNLRVGPSPSWMQYRLQYAGMRPINVLVDVTNYVMLETGQPLHAFDYDVLVKRAGGGVPAIVVRRAKAGERLTTLDGKDRELTPDVLVIADAAGPVALAGVMGGRDTEVTDATTNVLLESASFDAVSVRKTARALDLISEASSRFAKGVSPATVPLAARRAARLLSEHAGGAVGPGVVEAYPAPHVPQVVVLRRASIARVLGVALPDAEVARVLGALDFQVEPGADGWRVTVPDVRLDVQAGEADLIEELARVYGYDRLPESRLSAELPPQRNNDPLAAEERVRDLLAGLGLDEAIHYALTTPEREALLGVPAGEYVELVNPLSAERRAMRREVLPSLFEGLALNLKHTSDVRLFEIATVYHPVPGAKLPAERSRLGVVMTGPRGLPAWSDPPGVEPAMVDFFDLKGVVEALAREARVPAARFEPARDVPFLHPGRAARLFSGDTPLGVLGELHSKVRAAFKLGERDILVADLDLSQLLLVAAGKTVYVPVPTYQSALRDVAVLVDEATPAARVEAEICAGGGALLSGVRLFDVYRGESVPAGQKSLAYALTYQAADRTLTDKEIDGAHKAVEARLKQALGASIRGR